MAAALALPLTRADGSVLPDRLLVHFVTYVVILTTLALQGLSMPAVIRWARLPLDDHESDEQRAAERTITQAAVKALPLRAQEQGSKPDVVQAVRQDYQQHLATLAEESDPTRPTDSLVLPLGADQRLRNALIKDKRRALATLRSEHSVDDVVLRRVQSTIDAEELRLGVNPEE